MTSDRPPDPCGCSEPNDASYRLHRRFDRLGRMFGDDAVSALMDLRVVVFGVGGVGCVAAEALARSAVGHLMLVDFDDICITNSNRQLQAVHGTVGRPKAWVLRDRLRSINPQAQIDAQRQFYNLKRSEALLTPPWPGRAHYDWVVDCIDNFTAKAHLIATCRARGIPVISSMGAAGKIDPTRIKIADLADAFVCPMARELRKILRTKHDFPSSGPMGVPVVFSDEKRNWPRELHYDGGKGFHCVCGNKSDEHSCETRAVIDGTVMYVTGAFGFACASAVVNAVAVPLIERSEPAQAQKGENG
ncbi:MAG: tRNA threonylcarbamoyladenosine dehydratase [Deltaproteobacteria bacterium]|nr:tRNA threonylcarbamoyladenosine dehydratase [Deltaproteobacteria bacterium]